jgi:hypothetical protein
MTRRTNMGFSMAALLIHDERLPLEARNALRAASSASREDGRTAELELAARVLYRETELDCGDARELVGLEPGESCA